MKAQLSLAYILGFATFISRASLVMAIQTPASERLSSIQEAQEYTTHAEENASQVTKSILSISQDQHSYENTFSPCNQFYLHECAQETTSLDTNFTLLNCENQPNHLRTKGSYFYPIEILCTRQKFHVAPSVIRPR